MSVTRRQSLHPAGDSEPTGGTFGIGLQKHLLAVHLGQLQYHLDRPHSWCLRALPGDNDHRELFVPGMTLVMLHLEFGPRLIEFAPIVIGVSLLLSAETQVPWNFTGTVSAACVCPSRASVKAVVVNRLFIFVPPRTHASQQTIFQSHHWHGQSASSAHRD